MPTQTIMWLGLTWDSHTVTLCLSLDSRRLIRFKMYRTLFVQHLSRHKWVNLLGSLIYAA